MTLFSTLPLFQVDDEYISTTQDGRIVTIDVYIVNTNCERVSSPVLCEGDWKYYEKGWHADTELSVKCSKS